MRFDVFDCTTYAETVFPNEFIAIHTAIDKKACFQKNYNIEYGKVVENAKLDIIQTQTILKNQTLFNKIPSGSIANLVISNRS